MTDVVEAALDVALQYPFRGFSFVQVGDCLLYTSAAPDGHAEGGESEICVDAVGEGVADDLLCAKVFHNSAVEPAHVLSNHAPAKYGKQYPAD